MLSQLLKVNPPSTEPQFSDNDEVRLINNAFVYTSRDAKLATTGGCDLEHNKYVGESSAIMRLLTGKGEDLGSYFDKIDAIVIENASLKQILNINYIIDVNRRKEAQLLLETFSGFYRTFKK